MTQNLHTLFTDDLVERNMKCLKEQIFIALIKLIRDNGWSQSEAARKLGVSAPRMSNLFKGYLEKFSVDSLIEMMVRLGYKIETDFRPEQVKRPLCINLEKSKV